MTTFSDLFTRYVFYVINVLDEVIVSSPNMEHVSNACVTDLLNAPFTLLPFLVQSELGWLEDRYYHHPPSKNLFTPFLSLQH
jgi:hypothetical protein